MSHYLTSDPHFGHYNIIRFDGRPFADLHHMHTEMISNINEVVGEDDTLHLLGDLSMRMGWTKVRRLLSYIRCKDIRIIRGNHDKPGWDWFEVCPNLTSIEPMFYGELDGHKVIMCHFPLESWHRGYTMLHGHSHGRSRPVPYRLDVGCMVHGYYPIELGAAVQMAAEVIPVTGGSVPGPTDATGR